MNNEKNVLKDKSFTFETLYWLELLKATVYLSESEFTSIHKDAAGYYFNGQGWSKPGKLVHNL